MEGQQETVFENKDAEQESNLNNEDAEQESILDNGDADHNSTLDSEDHERESPVDDRLAVQKKNYKFGVIYLSYIPDGLTVRMLREIMSQFGEVGRIYLEPEASNLTSKRKKYTEGWVEFKKKRVAKEVATDLNGTEINYGKKHSILRGQIWSIKYLHKFKWSHLMDQLHMDKTTRDHKRRFEMSQVKKQADFYQKMTERSRFMKNRGSQRSTDAQASKLATLQQRQKKPIQNGNELSVNVDTDLLSCIFKKI